MEIKQSPTYLIRNPHSYCFRMVVPKDLRGILTRKELRYSLKTGNLSTAKEMARYLAGHVQQLFRGFKSGSLNTMNLSKEQTQNMVKKFLKERIEKYNKPIVSQDYADERDTAPFRNQEGLEETLDVIDEIRTDLNLKLQTGNYSLAERKALRLLAKEGFTESDIDRASPSYAELCSGIYRAWIKSLDYWQQKLTGDFSDDLEHVLNEGLKGEQPHSHKDAPVIQRTPQPKPEPEVNSKTISEILADYLEEGERAGKWTEKSKGEVESSMMLLLEYFGDIPVNKADRKMMGQFKRDLWKIPPNRNKAKAYRDKNIHELIALDLPPEKCIKELTVRDYLSSANTLFKYARINGEIRLNPAEDMTIKKTKRPDQQRKVFSTDDLKCIFGNPDQFTKPYMFWCPVIALFTGARLNEIAQLYLSDFEQHEGIWCININSDAEDKRLKNLSSHRLIPLHPFLIEDLKIIERKDSLKNQGKKRLFPELSLTRDGYGKSVSSWFGRFSKKIGLEEGKVFHSFRHSFGTNLSHNDINDHSLKALMGHSEAGVTFEFYVKRGNAEKLYKDLVNHLDYQIDISHLKNSKYVK